MGTPRCPLLPSSRPVAPNNGTPGDPLPDKYGMAYTLTPEATPLYAYIPGVDMFIPRKMGTVVPGNDPFSKVLCRVQVCLGFDVRLDSQ